MLKMCRLTMSPPTESDRAGLRGVYANETQRAAANRIGLGLLCIVAGMLFCGVILLLVVLRFDDDGSWPEHLPPLPWQIWLSTALLVLESAVLHAAVTSRSARARQKLLMCGLLIAMAFMAAQAWTWLAWDEAVAGMEGRRIAMTGLYVLSGVHLAHVLGGLVPLTMLVWYARGREWDERHRNHLRLTTLYWHFLDIVWIVLLVTLLLVL